MISEFHEFDDLDGLPWRGVWPVVGWRVLSMTDAAGKRNDEFGLGLVGHIDRHQNTRRT
jgi:hypothetical protein